QPVLIPAPRKVIKTDGSVEVVRVGPPVKADGQLGVQTATFNVTYSGFEMFPAAQAAFQAAVDIWATQVSSPVTISVTADWADLGGPGPNGQVLGQAGPGAFVGGFAGATRNTYYPIALARKISGNACVFESPTPCVTTVDIAAQFN